MTLSMILRSVSRSETNGAPTIHMQNIWVLLSTPTCQYQLWHTKGTENSCKQIIAANYGFQMTVQKAINAATASNCDRSLT